MKKITVLLADNQKIVREGLRMLVEREGDIEIVGEAQTGREAVELAQRLHPDVVIMEINLPMLNGFQATRQIRRFAPETKVLILSAYASPGYIEQILSLGATGYLIKQTSAEILARAIREVQSGRTYFSSTIAKYLNKKYRSIKDIALPHQEKEDSLTIREDEVLQLIAEGLANKEIANEIGISIKTVEKHRQNLMSKLDIHEIAGLTRYAIATGVIENAAAQPATDDIDSLFLPPIKQLSFA